MHHCYISGKSLSQCTKIKTLNLSSNHIMKIDSSELSCCVHLTVLDLSSNLLDNLSVSIIDWVLDRLSYSSAIISWVRPNNLSPVCLYLLLYITFYYLDFFFGTNIDTGAHKRQIIWSTDLQDVILHPFKKLIRTFLLQNR